MICSQRIIDLLFRISYFISLVFSEGRKFLQLHSHSGKPWIDIWTFWLLVTLCSIPRSLQYNCSVNGSVWIFIWVINWVMLTQHSPSVPLDAIAMVKKVLLKHLQYYNKICVPLNQWVPHFYKHLRKNHVTAWNRYCM